MKNSLSKFFILFLPIIVSVSSCSEWRKAVGKEKAIPDEFSIATTPSLIVPPGYKIDPDKIEKNRTDNNASNVLTKRLNIITNKKETSINNFIGLFSSNNTPKNIRQIVDEETAGIALSERSGIDILFGNTPSTGIIVDTKKESLRVRKKSNEDATPAFDKNTGKTILIK